MEHLGETDTEDIKDIMSGFVNDVVQRIIVVEREVDYYCGAQALDIKLGENVIGTIWIRCNKDEVVFFTDSTDDKMFVNEDLKSGRIWKEITADLLSEALKHQNKC